MCLLQPLHGESKVRLDKMQNSVKPSVALSVQAPAVAHSPAHGAPPPRGAATPVQQQAVKKTIQMHGRFRSTVQWKPEDWQTPLDALCRRLAQHAFIQAGNQLSGPVELTAAQFAILSGGEDALRRAREANDMPTYRIILKQYEERAVEFINRNRSDQQQQATATPAIAQPANVTGAK